MRFRYRSGVYHLARDFGLPVVPVASSLGWFWPQEEWRKRPGRAVLEFLDPIEPGEDKDAFLADLEAAVEDRTAELIAEATGRPITPAVRGFPTPAPRTPPRVVGGQTLVAELVVRAPTLFDGVQQGATDDGPSQFGSFRSGLGRIGLSKIAFEAIPRVIDGLAHGDLLQPETSAGRLRGDEGPLRDLGGLGALLRIRRVGHLRLCGCSSGGAGDIDLIGPLGSFRGVGGRCAQQQPTSRQDARNRRTRPWPTPANAWFRRGRLGSWRCC